MKKLFYLLIVAFTLASCDTYKTIGNIITYNANGDIVKEYENITIDESIHKGFGLNFFDGENMIIVSNSTPYTITYQNVKIEKETIKDKEKDITIYQWYYINPFTKEKTLYDVEYIKY